MRPAARVLATTASGVAPVVLLALIWLPLLAHYSVPAPRIGQEEVAAARVTPGNDVLLELRGFNVLAIEGRDAAMDLAVANGILGGRLALPGLPEAEISLPFSPDDLEGLPASLWLWFAGYVAPDFLLAAFEETGRVDYMDMARDMIVAWNRYEARQRLPNGYLWNDHAIVARVRVLGEFWRLYRERADFDPDVGRAVLAQAARYRGLLADPGHFTFSTNHGLMQNLGLLHAELAFPTLPDARRYGVIALDRLQGQLDYLIGADGVFRENSAGYQAFDLNVLGMTLRSLTMAAIPVPAELRLRYERGTRFLDQLERPDRTLPATGDTDGAAHDWLPRVARPDAAGTTPPLGARAINRPVVSTVVAAAGYAINWTGLASWPDVSAASQTVLTWTRPPAPSHEHADEPSVIIWAGGTSWLTSVGYWPYGDEYRPQAESWGSSNAPHLAGEPAESQRVARLRFTGLSAEASLVDVERNGPGSFAVRRQVVQVGSDLWIIFDDIRSAARAASETVWTLSSDVTAQVDHGSSSFSLSTEQTAATLAIAGSEGMAVRLDRGSLAPFSGWQVRNGAPEPAPAITTTLPAGDAWQVAVLSTAASGSPRLAPGAAPSVRKGSSADAWAVEVPLVDGTLVVSREGAIVAVGAAAGQVTQLGLEAAHDPSAEEAAMRAAFDRAAQQYPVFHDLLNRRVVATGVVIVLALGQAIVMLVGRRRPRRAVLSMAAVITALWVVVGAWLLAVLLPTWQVLALA